MENLNHNPKLKLDLIKDITIISNRQSAGVNAPQRINAKEL